MIFVALVVRMSSYWVLPSVITAFLSVDTSVFGMIAFILLPPPYFFFANVGSYTDENQDVIVSSDTPLLPSVTSVFQG